MLDSLLNGGTDTINTQPGGAVKGVDDAWTVILGGYTLMLPTVAELTALYNDALSNPPAGWATTNPYYWSATPNTPDTHFFEILNTGSTGATFDFTGMNVTFQVL